MQPGQDQFDAGNAFLGVDIDRHAAAVVDHLATAVRVKCHFDAARVAGQRLVHRVVHHFLRQMVGAGGIGVHAGPAFDRVKAGQDFDIGGIVTAAHG